MLDVVRYWLDLGLDGFRLDAVPYLYERDGTNGENLPETHEFLRSAPQGGRRHATRARCCWPRPTSGRATCVEYFGGGDECHMCFHFPLMPRMYLAAKRGDREPDRVDHGRDAARSPRAASGACSCATTTS